MNRARMFVMLLMNECSIKIQGREAARKYVWYVNTRQGSEHPLRYPHPRFYRTNGTIIYGLITFYIRAKGDHGISTKPVRIFTGPAHI